MQIAHISQANLNKFIYVKIMQFMNKKINWRCFKKIFKKRRRICFKNLKKKEWKDQKKFIKKELILIFKKKHM